MPSVTTARSGSPRAHEGVLVAPLLLIATLLVTLAPEAEGQVRRRHRDAGAEAPLVDAAVEAGTEDAAQAGGPASEVVEAPLRASADAGVQASAASSGAPRVEAVVRLRDQRVFAILAPLNGRSPDERAKLATQALEKALESDDSTIHIEPQGDLSVVFAGDRPIVELGADDAAAAGDATVTVHAASVASRIRDGLRAEKKRANLLTNGLTLLGALAAGVVALILGRRLGRLARRTTRWLSEHPEKLPELRVQTIAVLRPSTLRILLTGSLRLLTIVLQLALAYGWLLFSLYVFAPTRAYTEKLTDLVLAPVGGATTRLVGYLPVAVVSVVATAALIVFVRFVGAYFASASRGETTISWLPPDLIRPTSVVVRLGAVLLFAVIALPSFAGNQVDAISRFGLVLLLAFGLATIPILASIAVGIAVMYGGGLRRGDYVVMGALAGRVEELSVLEVRLTDGDGCALRVPHLFSLLHPTRVLGRLRPVSTELLVAAGAPRAEVHRALLEAASKAGVNAKVELVSLSPAGTLYRISTYSDVPDAQHRLISSLAEVIDERRFELGQPSS